ncbi:MAG: hypothetical protein E7532_06545 [Ruminococcaceae bacterium]|nr:hypothetical protein [Oscillospiraceae bacterium]
MLFVKASKKHINDAYKKKLLKAVRNTNQVSRAIIICSDGIALFDDSMDLLLDIYYEDLGLNKIKKINHIRVLAKFFKQYNDEIYYTLSKLDEMIHRRN